MDNENALTPLWREEVLQVEPPSREQEQILCLLVWLSLLSIEDLTRILPIGEKPLKNALSQLEARGLVAHVPLHEIGWPRHSRYYVTDLGLYVLVEGLEAPVSVPKLVKSYPVTRADLQARLASPIIHITLSTMISRLMAECPQGYQLTSYQQPWQERYTTLAGENHIFTCDAAFLLRTPVGDQHAFYVHIDQSERLFSAKAARRLLDSLFEMRKRYHLEGNAFPTLLLLSNLARFSFWSRLLDESPTLYGTRPLHGAIVNMSLIEQEGIYGPIWTPFDRLRTDAHRVGLSALFDLPATPTLIERFSQYFTFKHLLEEMPDGTRRTRQLPRFVGDSLEAEASRLFMQNYPTIAKCIADAMHTAKSERREMAASLSTLLSADQKSILAFLVRHPYLCEDDLQILLYPESTDVRRLWRHLDPLVEMKLVRRFHWKEARSARTSRRYQLTEAGLRYLSTRHQLSPAYYLFPVTKKEDRRSLSPLASDVIWTQRGEKLLRKQLAHTNGLYSCMRSIYAHQSDAYTIAFWKSAREAVLWYRDPLSGLVVFPRPDAEILYQRSQSQIPRSVLIEYDHGTTFFREYAAKFEAYSEYQYVTKTRLPPILVILHREASRSAMTDAIYEVGASHVPVVMVSEQVVHDFGLLPLLDTMHAE